MALFTLPPDLFHITCADLSRLQAPVFRGMPLLGQMGVGGGEVVIACQNYAVGTDRAAAA